MAANKELPREPTVPPRSGFVGTFLLAGCLSSSTVEMSYSCRIDLASNLAMVLRTYFEFDCLSWLQVN